MNSHKKIPSVSSLLSEKADDAKFKKNLFFRASEKLKLGVGSLAIGMKERAFDFSNVPQMKNEALTFVEYQDPKTHELKTDIYFNPSSKALQAGVLDWGTIFTVLLQPFSSAFYTASQGFTLESVAVGAAGVGSYFYGKKFVKKITVRGRLKKEDRDMIKLLVDEGTIGSVQTSDFIKKIRKAYVDERIQGISSMAENMEYEVKSGSKTGTYRKFIEASDLGDKSKKSTITTTGADKSTVSRETYAPLELAEQELAIRNRAAEIQRAVANKFNDINKELNKDGKFIPRKKFPIFKLNTTELTGILHDFQGKRIIDPVRIAEGLSLAVGEQISVYSAELKVFLSKKSNLPPKIRAISEFGTYLTDERITAKIRRTFNKEFDQFVMQTGDPSISGETITKLRLKAVWKHMPDDFKSYFMSGRGADEAFEIFYSSARDANIFVRNSGVIFREGKWQNFFNGIADFMNKTPGIKKLQMNATKVKSAISNHMMAGVIATSVLFLVPVVYSLGEFGYNAATHAFQRDITPEATAFLTSPIVASLLKRDQYPKAFELLENKDLVNAIVGDEFLKKAFQNERTYQFLNKDKKFIDKLLENSEEEAGKLSDYLKKNFGEGQQIQHSSHASIQIYGNDVIDGAKVEEIVKNGFDLYSDANGHYLTAPLQNGSIMIGGQKTYTATIIASDVYDIGLCLQPKVRGISVDGAPYAGPNKEGLLLVTAGSKDVMGSCNSSDKLKITTTVNFGKDSFTYTHHVENLTTGEPIEDKTVESDYSKSPYMKKVRDNPKNYEYTIGLWINSADYSKIK